MKKADNFDPAKWLVENKLTSQSKLNKENKSPLFPSNSISDFGNQHFDEIQDMFGKIRTKFQGTTTKGIEVAFAGSDEDDGIDISFDPKFEEMSDVYNEIEPVEIAGKTIYVNDYLNRNLDDMEDED